MNPDDQARWKNEALDEIFAALAARATLTGYVMYKGARILNRRLDDVTRQSLDIDMNMTTAFVAAYPSTSQKRAAFEREIRAALREHFARALVVRYDVERITVRTSAEHTLGWNAFEVLIGLRDFTRSNVRGLPSLRLDIAAPEELGARSTAVLAVDGHDVQAYTDPVNSGVMRPMTSGARARRASSIARASPRLPRGSRPPGRRTRQRRRSTRSPFRSIWRGRRCSASWCDWSHRG